MRLRRRSFLGMVAGGLAAPHWAAGGTDDAPLAGEVGITTSSLSGQVSASPKDGQFTLTDLPKVLRGELGMRVIDLNTSTLGSQDPAHVDRFRQAAEKAGCVIINLKMNQRGIDMNSPDKSVRQKALAEYKRSIATAARLGARWARPLPGKDRPDMAIHVASYRELCDFAGEHGVRMLIENFGWMDSDPDSVPTLYKAIDRKNLAVCPDTGNWSDDAVRYAGLAKAFPLAVTCDFKARQLGPAGEHPLYDLRRCFQVGWDAGFRGPWCLEHANADTKQLFTELALLRDMIRKWTAEAGK